MQINSEDLAYWFFRLNGFFTINNFIVHPDEGKNQRTDVDILGVRFPHRSELIKNPMEDYKAFTEIKKILIVFAEVKRGICNINGPWTDNTKENIQRVLRAVGTYIPSTIEDVANTIYKEGYYVDTDFRHSIIAIGSDINSDLAKKYPQIIQITFIEIKKFIFERFSKYPDRKADHSQWDENGKNLWQSFKDSNTIQEFSDSTIIQ